MFKIGSHDPFGHFKHKLWPKERSGVNFLESKQNSTHWVITIHTKYKLEVI